MSTPMPKRGFFFHLFDVVLNIVIIVSIVALIRTFIVSPFQIEGSSMFSTLENKEYIVINKFRYLFHTPDRGDIVVFRPPTDPSKYYVKRVIGLPGDTVIVRDGQVFIRTSDRGDIALEEKYLNSANEGRTFRYPVQGGDTTEEIFLVPNDHYFLLGDNRQASLDSRSFAHLGIEATPFVPRANIKGSVWFVALPITHIHAFEAPEYSL